MTRDDSAPSDLAGQRRRATLARAPLRCLQGSDYDLTSEPQGLLRREAVVSRTGGTLGAPAELDGVVRSARSDAGGHLPRRWAARALAVAVSATLGLSVLAGMRLDAAAPRTAPPPAASPAPAVLPVLHITPAAGTAVNPITPIVVRAVGGTVRSVAVTNTTSQSPVAGTVSSDTTTWTSTGPLSYGTTFQVAATAIGPGGAVTQRTAVVTTLSPAAEIYPALIPAPTSRAFGVGQIIGVSFDHDVINKAAAENALRVESNPAQSGSWYWIDKRTVHYRPSSYWQPGTTITVRANLYGVDVGNSVYGKSNREATYAIHDSWVAKADGATEQMNILHNGTLVKTMAMSLGSPGFPSHSGPHVISDKKPSITMDSCTYGVCKGEPGYYREQVALDERISNDGEFVHSAPWSVGQQGVSNVSHGCVNLSPANAQWFYQHFGLGDVVEITNSGGPQLPVWDTYGDWTKTWREWTAGSAVHD